MCLCEIIRDDIRLRILKRIESNIDNTIQMSIEDCYMYNNVTPIISDTVRYLDNKETTIKGIRFTKLEAILINSFSDFGSNYINHALASPKPTLNLHQKIIVDVFDKILRKIARTEKCYVYRMDKYGDTFLDGALKFLSKNTDKVINIPWFLSTTEYEKPWCKIVWKIAITDMTKTKARCFHPLIDNFRDELEVRFERNAKFKIKGVEENEHYIVNMEEVYSKNHDISMDYTKYNN